MLQSIYAHASWANRKLFDTTAQLSKEQLVGALAGSEPILDTLVHLVDVQRTWLARAQQLASPPALDGQTSLAELREVWEDVDGANQRYLASLSAGDLAEIVRYVNLKGEPQAYPRWQILLHQVLHAAQHRAEVALLLTQLGHSAGWMDYLIYIDEGMGA
jgi:uncharacterized damage-inducible protein DinB